MTTMPPPNGATWRENGGVSDLPPPPIPPAGRPQPLGSDIDWHRLEAIARRWYQPLLERPGWMAALYLLVGMFSSIGFFVALIVVGSTVFGLCFAGIGLLLIGPFFRMVEALAGAERKMTEWVGVRVQPRPITPIRGLGIRAVGDRERWRQVGFLALNLVVGVTIGNVGLAAYWLVPRFAFDDPTGFNVSLFGINPVLWVVGLVIAALLLGAAPRIAVFVARFKAQVTSWFLGPDQLAAAELRVETLSTQRQEILDAVALERRRIERNLHDGVQQQLVAIGLDLGMAANHIYDDPPRAKELIGSAREKVQGSIGELRQLGRGLHPAILEDRGIDAALSAVVSGSPIPISVHVDPDLDLPRDVAETVYFVANESIANVLKHAKARVASVHVTRVGEHVRVTVHDDGIGGADPRRGSGLAGIRARVNGVDGVLTVTSPVGGPTTIVAEMRRDG